MLRRRRWKCSWSVRYRQVSGWTADRIPCCVVARRVFCTVSSPTFHKRLRVSGVAAECRVVVSTIFIVMSLYRGCQAAIPGTACHLSLNWECRGAISGTPCRSMSSRWVVVSTTFIVMSLYWGCRAAIPGTACRLSFDSKCVDICMLLTARSTRRYSLKVGSAVARIVSVS